ncbi:MAG TPA: glutamine-hydrolyzing GMP synthase [Candidatus Limnocylindrales bacterium]|nr:glutamine-hydrolyzing GMP synthase [Candidatus Limnocylindrales bacterium]
MNPNPQIIVLDAGGQYCHLITRKVRDLGVYAEVRASETAASELAGARGVIISGGPSSVYDAGSPTVDPALFDLHVPVLGICYGQQLMAHILGGDVRRGEKGEYGLATLHLDERSDPLFAGLAGQQQIWMSHRDTVDAVPPGFAVAGRTSTCAVAAIAAPEKKLYGLQFHPEVAHTARGRDYLTNFVFRVCECRKDWDARERLPEIQREIRDCAGSRNVFFFVSGGVDSSVAFALCTLALGADRVRGVYVDTGLMREGETGFVGKFPNVTVEHAADQFLGALAGVTDPEQKRHIIGEEFVRVQERIVESRHLMDEQWILGQGTIYPDTIESGGTAKASLIKTHHNRVAGIQKLIECGRIVEPLKSFYKDEVREAGLALGLPAELLERHPFPGPGLAIRCLCSEFDAPVRQTDDGIVIPVNSVGVQGDSRSYAPVLAIDSLDHGRATELVNSLINVNRVITAVATREPLLQLQVRACSLTGERIERLRRADAIVRRMSHDADYDRKVWQFPVILIPLGSAEAPDSVVLRPVDSVDGMTAQSVTMPPELLEAMQRALLAEPGIAGVFYDLTHKPPGTIEWE